ncbi:hypothetical protein [Streptomyces blattellae]|uniref:hypothetical protein n=1 Tax=Streptomyces blattellae TaxID=2569855 RepID=UPI0012B6E646|nr:hypothetical protein [Streptomyces blattellae]
MDSPTPLLVIPALLWTAVAAASLIASIALSVRARRWEKGSDAWNPFDTDSPVIAVGAIAGYAVAAVIGGHLSAGSAAFSILWPAMAGSALTYAAGRRTRSWPRRAGAAFAAAGAALFGSLPT